MANQDPKKILYCLFVCLFFFTNVMIVLFEFSRYSQVVCEQALCYVLAYERRAVNFSDVAC